MKITYRQATQDDYQFLYELKVASMRDYVDQVYGWDDAFQEEFFEKDFRADDLTIIQVDGRDLGMYELSKDKEGLFIKRIEIHPESQNKGIGSQVIQHILSENESTSAWLMVFKINPAQKLYERLGFVKADETDTHFKMIRQNKAL